MWTNEVEQSFRFLKKKVTKALVLPLPYFDKVFEVDYDASHLGIGVVLSQVGRPILFLSKKMDEIRNKSSTYDV